MFKNKTNLREKEPPWCTSSMIMVQINVQNSSLWKCKKKKPLEKIITMLYDKGKQHSNGCQILNKIRKDLA